MTFICKNTGRRCTLRSFNPEENTVTLRYRGQDFDIAYASLKRDYQRYFDTDRNGFKVYGDRDPIKFGSSV